MKLNFLLLFFFIALLDGCTQKIDSKELEQSFKESIDFSKLYNDMIVIKFEKEYADNPKKIKRAYDKMKRIRNQVTNYISDVNYFYNDSAAHKSMEELIKEYDNITDTIIKSIHYRQGNSEYDVSNNERLSKLFTNRDFLKIRKEQSDKLVALQIINNVYINETYLYREILKGNFSNDFSFTVFSVEPYEPIQTQKGGYTIGLSSGYFAEMSAINVTDILIDSLVYNGKVIKRKFTTKVNYSFADISFDSMEKGCYYLKGNVQIYHNAYGRDNYPFRYEFEIK